MPARHNHSIVHPLVTLSTAESDTQLKQCPFSGGKPGFWKSSSELSWRDRRHRLEAVAA
jgi:hypothetical protein